MMMALRGVIHRIIHGPTLPPRADPALDVTAQRITQALKRLDREDRDYRERLRDRASRRAARA